MSNKKESVEDFLDLLEDFKPAIPDEVVSYFLKRTGFTCSDPRVTRMIALAAQKFISDVCTDSLHYCKLRQQNPILRERAPGKEKRYVLSTEDLASALKEYGITVKKPDYYSDKTQLSRGSSS